jgi:plastocyanin
MRNPRRCRYLPIVALAGLLWSPAQAAEEHEFRMLNRGEAGIMVFEPAYLEIAPGDTVHFRAADRGHNAAAIDAMVPPGGESWAGQLNQDVSITSTAEGVRSDRAADRRAQSRSVDLLGRHRGVGAVGRGPGRGHGRPRPAGVGPPRRRGDRPFAACRDRSRGRDCASLRARGDDALCRRKPP